MPETPSPFFSVVIPTYRRPEALAVCLQSLSRQEYPRERFEVIVVDDGGRGGLERVVAPFRRLMDLRLVVQPHGGPAQARNTGAAHARGRYLAFTDDDCAPAPFWLRALEARFAARPDTIVGGRTLNALPHRPCSAASQLLLDHVYSHFNADPEDARFFATMNLAVPADAFRALGGFDTTYPLAAGEDREFCLRWVSHGYRMRYAPEVVVWHAHPLTLASFWRQHLNYGRGAYCFHRTRAGYAPGPVRLEPVAFYVNLVRTPFARPGQRRRWLLTALLAVSQVANAAGYFRERLGVGSHHRAVPRRA